MGDENELEEYEANSFTEYSPNFSAREAFTFLSRGQYIVACVRSNTGKMFPY